MQYNVIKIVNFRIMRIMYFNLFLLILNACSPFGESTEMISHPDPDISADLYGIFVQIPDEMVFDYFRKGEGQIQFESQYSVRGKNASEIEQFLCDHFGMNMLTFNCCAWEPVDGLHGTYGHEIFLKEQGAYIAHIITMFSEETLVNTRANWDSIPAFYVQVQTIQF
jgi:hypothetical protein